MNIVVGVVIVYASLSLWLNRPQAFALATDNAAALTSTRLQILRFAVLRKWRRRRRRQRVSSAWYPAATSHSIIRMDHTQTHLQSRGRHIGSYMAMFLHIIQCVWGRLQGSMKEMKGNTTARFRGRGGGVKREVQGREREREIDYDSTCLVITSAYRISVYGCMLYMHEIYNHRNVSSISVSKTLRYWLHGSGDGGGILSRLVHR